MTYAFEIWDNGGIQISSLHQGNAAEVFALRHYQSNTFAVLHYGGEEVKTLYESIEQDLAWTEIEA